MLPTPMTLTTCTSPLVVGLVTLALAGACDPSHPTGRAASGFGYDRLDRQTMRAHRIYLDRPGIQEELAGEEMGFFGPFEDEYGAYVVVHTTGAHVGHYEATGARVTRHHARPDAASSVDVGRVQAGLGECLDTPVSVPPEETDLMLRYDNLVTEVEALETTGITVETIGLTYESRDIIAARVGPLGTASNAPTLVLVAGQHARERVTVGVALGLLRWLGAVVNDPMLDPAVYAALQQASILVVPSANPDGYEYTWTGSRNWRGNRNVAECASGGVDLNRNLPTAWQSPTDAPSTASSCTSLGIFWGNTLQPENEALEDLLDGASPFENLNARALINYHSHASLLLYPAGWKAATDAAGPRCGTDGNAFGSSFASTFCTNPDFTVLRHLFGNTEATSGLWTDLSLGSSNPADYYRDHVNSALYPVSGDLGTHAQYAHEVLAVSPELPGFCQSFGIEYLPDPDTAVLDIVDGQKAVIERLLTALPGLAATSVMAGYSPNELGTIAPTLFVREYTEHAFDEDETHGMFVTPLWRHADSGSLSVTISGTSYPMSRLRPGTQYNLYGLSSASGAFDADCPPCLLTFDETDAGVAVPGCTGCVDLCDPERLDFGDFSLEPSEDWGTSSCVYVAENVEATIDYPPSIGVPSGATSCYFTFSAYGNQYSFTVERDNVEIYRSHPAVPYNTAITSGSTRQLVSYAFEANGLLPTAVPGFTIRTVSYAPGSEPLRIYDPVIYCRFGSIP